MQSSMAQLLQSASVSRESVSDDISIDYPHSHVDEGVVFYTNQSWISRSSSLRMPSFRREASASAPGPDDIRHVSLVSQDSADPEFISDVYPDPQTGDAVRFHTNHSFRSSLVLPGGAAAGRESEDQRRFEKTGCMWMQRTRKVVRLKSWDMKWFTIREGSTLLRWWHDEDMVRSAGQIDIEGCEVVRVGEIGDKSFCFQLRAQQFKKPPRALLTLACTTATDLDQWEQVLSHAVLEAQLARSRAAGVLWRQSAGGAERPSEAGGSSDLGSKRVGTRDKLYLRRSEGSSSLSGGKGLAGRAVNQSLRNLMRYARLQMHLSEREVLDKCVTRLAELEACGELSVSQLERLVHEVATHNRDVVAICTAGSDAEVLDLALNLDVMTTGISSLDGTQRSRKDEARRVLHERNTDSTLDDSTLAILAAEAAAIAAADHRERAASAAVEAADEELSVHAVMEESGISAHERKSSHRKILTPLTPILPSDLRGAEEPAEHAAAAKDGSVQAKALPRTPAPSPVFDGRPSDAERAEAKEPLVSSMVSPARSALRGAEGAGAAPEGRRVGFGALEIRFYNYTLGESVPSDGGPSLGLAWEVVGRMETTVDDFEELRGGNVDDDYDEDEEWQESWRVPREFFGEDGHVDRAERVRRLSDAGHRRTSIDLNAFQFSSISTARMRRARDKAATLVIQGQDPDEVQDWERRMLAAEVITRWAKKALLADGASA